MRFRQCIQLGLLTGLAAVAASSTANAQVTLPGAAYSITCQDGADYVLRSGPVSIPGDVVTARLFLTPRHGVPVRLIPMGMGYRYAGRGVWLDGIREHALLYRTKYAPVPCIVGQI